MFYFMVGKLLNSEVFLYDIGSIKFFGETMKLTT